MPFSPWKQLPVLALLAGTLALLSCMTTPMEEPKPKEDPNVKLLPDSLLHPQSPPFPANFHGVFWKSNSRDTFCILYDVPEAFIGTVAVEFLDMRNGAILASADGPVKPGRNFWFRPLSAFPTLEYLTDYTCRVTYSSQDNGQAYRKEKGVRFQPGTVRFRVRQTAPGSSWKIDYHELRVSNFMTQARYASGSHLFSVVKTDSTKDKVKIWTRVAGVDTLFQSVRCEEIPDVRNPPRAFKIVESVTLSDTVIVDSLALPDLFMSIDGLRLSKVEIAPGSRFAFRESSQYEGGQHTKAWVEDIGQIYEYGDARIPYTSLISESFMSEFNGFPVDGLGISGGMQSR